MNKSTVLAVSLVASFLAEATPFRTIQRIWAVSPEKIEAAMAQYPGAFSDGIIIATFAGLKIGPEEARDFEKQKAFIRRMKARGTEVQICISSSIGHKDEWTVGNDLPKMVGSDGKAANEVGKGGKMFVFGKGGWGKDTWYRKSCLRIKDELDKLAGGRMPSRVDTCVRLAQSVWESPDGKERVVILFNLDFDDAADVRLTENVAFTAERLGSDGSWTQLGKGDSFSLALIPAWSATVVRLRK